MYDVFSDQTDTHTYNTLSLGLVPKSLQRCRRSGRFRNFFSFLRARRKKKYLETTTTTTSNHIVQRHDNWIRTPPPARSQTVIARKSPTTRGSFLDVALDSDETIWRNEKKDAAAFPPARVVAVSCSAHTTRFLWAAQLHFRGRNVRGASCSQGE